MTQSPSMLLNILIMKCQCLLSAHFGHPEPLGLPGKLLASLPSDTAHQPLCQCVLPAAPVLIGDHVGYWHSIPGPRNGVLGAPNWGAHGSRAKRRQFSQFSYAVVSDSL